MPRTRTQMRRRREVLRLKFELRLSDARVALGARGARSTVQDYVPDRRLRAGQEASRPLVMRQVRRAGAALEVDYAGMTLAVIDLGTHQPHTEPVIQDRADRSTDADDDQQQPAGNHRRQHPRQMNQRIQDRAAREAITRQDPGRKDRDRQAEANRPRCHGQPEADCFPFSRGEQQAIRP
jgi:hypothetical protein